MIGDYVFTLIDFKISEECQIYMNIVLNNAKQWEWIKAGSTVQEDLIAHSVILPLKSCIIHQNSSLLLVNNELNALEEISVHFITNQMNNLKLKKNKRIFMMILKKQKKQRKDKFIRLKNTKFKFKKLKKCNLKYQFKWHNLNQSNNLQRKFKKKNLWNKILQEWEDFLMNQNLNNNLKIFNLKL